jgi:hypothetical protein
VPRLLAAIGTVSATLLVSATSIGNAATLGGLGARSLLAINQTASGIAPTVLTCDDFSRAAATGSALNGRPVQLPANCGAATWTTRLGTWTITSGQLAASTTDATATVAAGQTSTSAQATILNANGTSRVAGVAIDHTGGSRIYLAGVLSGPSSAQLRLVNGATVSTLASATVTIGATAVVRITRNASAVTVSVNGTQAIAFTLNTTQITTLAGGTLVGLYWNAGSTVRFTDVLATTPVAP